MIFGFLADRASRTTALVFALNGWIFANWFARIPAVKANLGLSDGALGSALLGTPVGSLLVMGGTGWLIGRCGADRVTMASAALLCLLLPLPALASGAPSLAGALFLLGAASAAMDVAMNAEAALIEQRVGRSIMVGFHAAFSLGGVVGAVAGSLAAGLVAPLPHLLAAALLGMLVLYWRRGSLPAEQPPANAGAVFAFPRGALVPIALVAFATMLAEGAAADWSAVYIRDVLDSSLMMAGAGYAAFATGMTVGRLTGDQLGDRLGEARLIGAGGLVGGLGLGAALLIAHPAAAIVGFLALGLGLAAIVPICFRRAAGAPGSSAGHGLAAVATVGYAGFLAGPPLIGLLAEVFGLGVSLGLVPILVIGVALAGAPLFANLVRPTRTAL